MKRFDLLEPKSTEEACQLLTIHGEQAKVLSGGTALLKLMKKRLVHPSYLLNIKGIKELNYIREDNGGLKIGALATLREVETNPLIQQKFGVLTEMAHAIGSVQIRNMATLIGNLCFADPASDPAPLLIALKATLKIKSVAGQRLISLDDFFKDFYETALERNEIVEELQIPTFPKNSGFVYLKHSMRAAFDLAIVGVAVSLYLDSKSGVCQDIRIVLGGVSSTPIRARKAEVFVKGKAINESLIMGAAMAAAEEVDPIHDVRASSEYRGAMIEVFVERGIRKAFERAKGWQSL